jgi:hypothetical protein
MFKLLRSPRIDSKEPINSLVGRYDNPIPTRSLAPIDCLKIPAQISDGYLKKFTNKNYHSKCNPLSFLLFNFIIL